MLAIKNKKLLIFWGVVILATAVTISILFLVKKPKIEKTALEKKEYFQDFKRIIESDTSSSEKSRAILEMAHFATKEGDAKEAVNYLKNLAEKSTDPTIISSCYSAIDLIRSSYPIENLGEFFLSVEGEMKVNSPIKVLVNVKIFKDCKGSVSIARLPIDFKLKSNPIFKFEAKAGETKNFTFEMVPEKEGDYPMSFNFFLEKDKFDYQQETQKILFKIGKERGEFLLLEKL